MKRSELKAIIADCIKELEDSKSLEERDYRKEYDNYQGKEEQKKNRAKRNNARRRFERDGRVSKGDGKDIDHKTPLRSGGGNTNDNLRVVGKSGNRSRNGSS